MNTDRVYKDGIPIPYPSYRCKAKAHGKGHGSHGCKLHVDHDGDHLCLCGKSWEPVAA